MSHHSPSTHARDHADRPRRFSARTWILLALVLVLALLAWLGYAVYTAYTGLAAARDDVVAARAAIVQGDSETARARVDDAIASSGDAADATGSPIWRAAAAVPWLGSPLQVVGPLSDIVRDVTTEVLDPAVEVGSALNPGELRADDGTIDLASLRESAPALAQISGSAAALNERTAALDTDTYVGQVTDAAESFRAQLGDLSNLLTNTSLAAQVLPEMLGETTPTSYFLAFQTGSESRGTGGLMGGFAIVDADRGRITLDELARNTELQPSYDPIDLGPDFARNYAQYDATSNWQNANVSPHFPYTGEILRSIWQQESGQSVDGVLATDPVALSYILDVVGPVILADGEQITADNVVDLTQSQAYFRFEDDNNARKEYLQSIAAGVFAKVQGSISSPERLLEAIGRGVSERHTAVWSANPEIQAALSGTPIAHEVPEDAAPYAAVVVNNGAGGKLDYYLRRDTAYTAESCEGDTRRTQITATVTNTAPAQEYPRYIAGRQNESTAYEGPPGTNRSVLEVFTTTGSELVDATLDGQKTFLLTMTERGRPVFYTPLVVEPGETRTLVLDLVEPTAPGEARVPIQPQTLDAEASADVPNCAD